MGWTRGQGLGKENSGIIEPIKQKSWGSKTGLGASQAFQTTTRSNTRFRRAAMAAEH
jgi:hypothetical protein